jgi:hypothetical protein
MRFVWEVTAVKYKHSYNTFLYCLLLDNIYVIWRNIHAICCRVAWYSDDESSCYVTFLCNYWFFHEIYMTHNFVKYKRASIIFNSLWLCLGTGPLACGWVVNIPTNYVRDIFYKLDMSQNFDRVRLEVRISDGDDLKTTAFIFTDPCSAENMCRRSRIAWISWWTQRTSLKCRCTFTTLQGTISQKTVILLLFFLFYFGTSRR